MKIFFLMRHSGYVRNYESVLKLLGEHKHHVHLGLLKWNKMYEEEDIKKLLEKFPNVSYTIYPKQQNLWNPLSKAIRRLQDYLRYLSPQYNKADKLRERAASRIPKPIIWFFKAILRNNEKRIWFLIEFLRKLEQAIPENKRIRQIISSSAPDIFLITPLIDFGASQLDWLKCAKSLGIKTCFCVASWDNLTNKGLVQLEPDSVMVWNDYQKEELINLHKIKSEKIIVTGAQCYDQWFERQASLSREEFCSKVGLESKKSFILYLCSSPFISPDEVKFVKKWVKAVRTHKNSDLKDVGILIRPHPQNAAQWEKIDFVSFDNISIFPKTGRNPIDSESKEDFFHSIYFSEAVIGVNTSAMIESGILGKPVFTILYEEFSKTQEGTLHFDYIQNGGLLYVAEELNEHLTQMEKVLNNDVSYKERIRIFINKFVRPRGLNNSATSAFVKAIEDMAKIVDNKRCENFSFALFIRKIFLFPLAILFFLSDSIFDMKEKRPLKKVNNKPFKKTNKIKKNMRLFLNAVKPVLLPIANSIRRTYFMREYIIPWLIKEQIGGLPHSTDIAKINNEISVAVSGGKPIIVGPWLSEIGFELLYWIPFLKWVADEYKIKADRFHIISRGGTALWYKNISEKYIDAFEYFTTDDLKKEHESRIADTGGQKHLTISNFDRELIRRAAEGCGLKDFNLLHPTLMYELFSFYWRRRYPISLISKHTKYERYQRPEDKKISGLPDKYIAVKFYFNPSFPDIPENHMFIARLLEKLTKTNKVVLLSSGIDIDDHHEYDNRVKQDIFVFKNITSPKNNIEIQTKIISGAELFIGTYGGFSYLAPFYGVPSMAIYSHEYKFLPVHLDVAYRACRSLKFGEFDKMIKEDPAKIDYKSEFIPLNISHFDILKLLS